MTTTRELVAKWRTAIDRLRAAERRHRERGNRLAGELAQAEADILGTCAGELETALAADAKPTAGRESTQTIARRLFARRADGWDHEPPREDPAERYLSRLIWSLDEGLIMADEEFADLAELLRRATEGR